MNRYILGVLLLLIAPWSAIAAPDGEQLYKRHCAACHGYNGAGGVGVPLSLPDFLATVDDRYLHETIRLGRPGRVMPAFNSLSSAQLTALVAYLRRWQPEGLSSSVSSEPITGNAQRGERLYDVHCQNCHGVRGEGGEGTGVTFSRSRDFEIMPTALNNSGFLASASDAVIKATLIRGREGTSMDSFLDEGLSEGEINDIVAYIRTFEGDTKAGLVEPAEEMPILEADSPYPMDVTIENVKRAAIGKNFRIIRVQELEQGIAPEGEEQSREVIIYFCNFQMIDDALKADPRVGLFLPCRVTVVQSEDGVKVMSINPKSLAKIYNNSLIDESCRQMYEIYTEILDEATF